MTTEFTRKKAIRCLCLSWGNPPSTVKIAARRVISSGFGPRFCANWTCAGGLCRCLWISRGGHAL